MKIALVTTSFLPQVGGAERMVHELASAWSRDGHDVVASFRDRWGYTSAARAARTEWARYVDAARGLGRRLPGERFL